VLLKTLVHTYLHITKIYAPDHGKGVELGGELVSLKPHRLYIFKYIRRDMMVKLLTILYNRTRRPCLAEQAHLYLGMRNRGLDSYIYTYAPIIARDLAGNLSRSKFEPLVQEL
jgi:hypothetical protein